MDLKELLGDAYKEGMTFDEISTALSNKKLADLSSGAYVNKEAADAEKRRLEQEKRDLEEQLNSKLTDDEKASKIAEEKDKQIQKLINQLKENTMSTNKGAICVGTSDIRAKVGIKNEDEKFNKFVNLIAHENTDENTYVSSYLNEIMTTAYDKGLEDAKKQQIADNKFQAGSGADGKSKDEDNIGAKLAKGKINQNKNRYNYFE